MLRILGQHQMSVLHGELERNVRAAECYKEGENSRVNENVLVQ